MAKEKKTQVRKKPEKWTKNRNFSPIETKNVVIT